MVGTRRGAPNHTHATALPQGPLRKGSLGDILGPWQEQLFGFARRALSHHCSQAGLPQPTAAPCRLRGPAREPALLCGTQGSNTLSKLECSLLHYCADLRPGPPAASRPLLSTATHNLAQSHLCPFCPQGSGSVCQIPAMTKDPRHGDGCWRRDSVLLAEI